MATATEFIERVERAFAGLKLGEGVLLLEAFVIDCYGSDEERAAARQKDEHHDWRKLIDSKLLCGLALCFMDDAGMRFHLPACLVTALRPESTNFDIAYDALLFHFTRKGSVNLFAFSVVEIQLILEIMLLLRERTPNHLLEKSSRCIKNLRSKLLLMERLNQQSKD